MIKKIKKYSLTSILFITFKIIGSESPSRYVFFSGTHGNDFIQSVGSPANNDLGSFESISVRSLSLSSQNDTEILATQSSANGTEALITNKKAVCCRCSLSLFLFKKNKKHLTGDLININDK